MFALFLWVSIFHRQKSAHLLNFSRDCGIKEEPAEDIENYLDQQMVEYQEKSFESGKKFGQIAC